MSIMWMREDFICPVLKFWKIAFDNARNRAFTETGDYQKFLTEMRTGRMTTLCIWR